MYQHSVRLFLAAESRVGLLQGGYVSLEGLLSYLSPTVEDLSASYKARFEQLRDEVKGLSLANLGESNATAENAAAAEGAAAGGTGGGRVALLTGTGKHESLQQYCNAHREWCMSLL